MINLDAETALLGACLLNPDALDIVDGIVAVEDFHDQLHATLFRTFLEARDQRRRITIDLVKAVLGDDANAEIANGVRVGDYIRRLVADAPSVINAPDFARMIAEAAQYRRVIETAEIMQARARTGYKFGLPPSIASEAIAELDKIITASAAKGVQRVTLQEALDDAVEAFEDRAVHGVVDGVSTGLVDLDKVTQFYPGELVIVAARPSMGKTTIALQFGMAAAKQKCGTMFVSLEMGQRSLAQRVISDLTYNETPPIHYTDIRDGNVPEGERYRIHEAKERAKEMPLLIEQQPGLTVSQIAARTRASRTHFKRQWNVELGMLVIDHLGLISSGDRYHGNRNLELGAITSSLKVLAKELQIPVVLLCQLNRATESRDNKRPQLSDLRESGKIEEDADTVMLLYREAYYLERAKETDAEKELARAERLRWIKNDLEINVAKQRQGPTETVTVFVNMATNSVRNKAREY